LAHAGIYFSPRSDFALSLRRNDLLRSSWNKQVARRLIRAAVWHSECSKAGCSTKSNLNIEDTPMAVTKKSVTDSTPAAKTPKTKAEKASATTPAAPSKMKTAFVKYN